VTKWKKPFGASVLLAAAATVLGKSLLWWVTPENHVMLYLLAVVISGLWWGKESAVLTSVLGVLAFDVFFVPPFLSLAVADAQYLITFGALLVVALVIGTLTGQLRDNATALRTQERETSALYAFSRRMVAARDTQDVTRAVVSHLADAFTCATALLLPDGSLAVSPGFAPSEQELAAARALLKGEPCPDAPQRIPLQTPQGVVGVLVIGLPAGASPFTPDRRHLLEAFVAQAAVVVERAQLAEAAQRGEMLMEAEKLHDALLHSISHALRTPLASIIGSLSTLLDPHQSPLDPATRRDLAETAREEAERLNGLVGNLLDMTRLEAGHLHLLIDQYDLEDVIGAAIGQADRSLQGHHLRVDMQGDLPLVPLDQVLIVQVLANLLDNAAKYSPPGSTIEIGVRAAANLVRVQVADRGMGIPEAERERVFEKFHRVQRPGSPIGTGLGLAICKGIVEAHRGRIWAQAREGGGAVVAFTLPLKEERDST